MKSSLKPTCTLTLAALLTFLPALYTHATPLKKVDSQLNYIDTHPSELNSDSKAPHPNSATIIDAVVALSMMGVTQTNSNNEDIHDNELKLSLKEASKDTHANAKDDVHANKKTRMLTQVPYSALGVLPTREHDSKFSYGEDTLQTVYVWHGRGGIKNQFAGNVVIFVHGGCWLNAYGYDHAKGFYYALAELGVGVYAMEYRRVGDEGGGWPGSLEDVINAVKASIEKIEAMGESRNIFVVGHSAGGHLGLLAAQQLSGSDIGASIKQVVGLAAITDMQRYAHGKNSCQTATPKFMGGMPEDKFNAYKMATPGVVDIQPSVILLQGNQDSIVPEHHAAMVGAKNRIVTNGGHFDWLHPESTSFDALLEVLGEHDK
ncbi:S9 family peptidase [Alteromonas sp. ALT199]|nr:alpha/beta hydrolase [Alteromonas sp. ALT199]